jgi:hypothetical protein
VSLSGSEVYAGLVFTLFNCAVTQVLSVMHSAGEREV